MDIKRQVAVMVLIGAGVGLAGCQTGSLGGLSIWNRGNGSTIASATPDVGKQKFDGLSQQFAGNQPRAAGQSRAGTTPLGGQKPAEEGNFLTASWKKTTAAVGGALAVKPKTDEPSDDPLRLDHPSKKVGADAHVAAARLLENQSKFSEAEAHYQKALQTSPSDLNALVGLARLHDRQGNSQAALEMYHQALNAHPTSSLVQNDLGLCYARQRQFDKSLQALHTAVELQPDNPKYRNNLATVLVEAGRTDEALSQLTAITTRAVAHYNVGYLLQRKGQTDEAMRHYQQALALDPAMTPARDMLTQLGGSFGAGPVAAQTLPRPAVPPMPAPASRQPAAPPMAPFSSAQSAAPPTYESASPYMAGSAGQPIHTSVPQLPPGLVASPPANLHIGDDEGPAAQTASRGTDWTGWSPGGTARNGALQPLPPLE